MSATTLEQLPSETPEADPDSQSSRTRTLAVTAAGLGTVGVASLGVVGGIRLQGWLAAGAIVALGIAVVTGSLWTACTSPARAPSGRATAERRSTRFVAVGVGVLATTAAQTWFTWGRGLAGGDIAPPEGIAWIAHIFSPLAWTGSNLGGPNANAVEAPWAALLWAVHVLGGPAWLAQRLWLTLLFAGAALAALALLRTLGLRPVPAGVGALFYVGNPYVVSNVGINDVYLAAMVLLAAYPAAILAAAQERITRRTAVVMLAAGAPLLGFAYSNPPLAVLVAVTTGLAVVVAWWTWGLGVARRAGVTLLIGALAVATASAYWIVPSLLALSAVATGRLSSLGSWGWTEGRANLANGLWLNTTWGWKFPIYYPYAPGYSRFPLDVASYALPALAFAALVLALSAPTSPRVAHLRRLALAGAGGALFLVVLGTGTTPPGSVLFDPLYALPYGWLLQDPGRLLMAASLAYALLVAVAVELGPPLLVRAARSVRRVRADHRGAGISPWAAAAVAGGVLFALLPAFPLATGQVAPAGKRGIYPSARVAFPAYWTAMATYLNRDATPGNILVLPQDDFYQMPYTWGYYGNDGFITDLISRHVLDPTAQGYARLGAELAATDTALSDALVARHWRLATDLLDALGTPDLLVRGDIDATFPGRHIVSPHLLAARLRSDPAMRLVHRDGPLELFTLRPTAKGRATQAPAATPITTRIATTDTSNPDLAVLGDLAPGTALVSMPMTPGVPAVLEAGPVATWRLRSGAAGATVLSTTVPSPAGWRYRLVALGAVRAKSRRVRGAPRPAQRLVERRQAGTITLSLRLGTQAVTDGNFAFGPWQPSVGNCDDVGGRNVGAGFGASVIDGTGPGGTSALRLRASVDSACESTPIAWHGGSLLVSLWVRDLGGARPRICIWETLRRACAAETPSLPSSAAWAHVQAVVTPNPTAGHLELFAYADSTTPGQVSTDEFADVAAYPVPSASSGRPVLLATPDRPSRLRPRLELAGTSYAPGWSGPPGRHVLVDGMRNGWLLDPGSVPGPATFTAARWDGDADALSALSGILVLAVGASVLLTRRRRPRTPPSRTGGTRR